MGNSQRWWTIGGGLLGITLLSVAVYNYCRCYCGAPVRLTLSGGNVCPLRTEMATRIAASISGDVEVSVCSGANSEQICAAVNEGKLDLGLIDLLREYNDALNANPAILQLPAPPAK